MERKKFNIIANFDETDSITSEDILVVEGDYKSIEFDFQLSKTDYDSAMFYMVKPDGTHFSSLITNNKVEIDDSSVFNQSGIYLLGIALYGTDSRLTNSQKGKLEVVNGQLPPDDEVTAEANYPILDQLILQVTNLLYDNAIYGVRRALSNNSNSAWERIYASQTLVANATHDGTAVVNDFDKIYPWRDIKSYNYDTTNHEITAWYGDANFKFDGSNGEVLTRIPAFYWKRYRDATYEYILITASAREDFNYSPAFSVGRYLTSYDGSKAHSYAGCDPEINRSIVSFRTISKALGSDFGQLDYRYFILQLLYLVEYADYNSQTKLGGGISGMRVSNDDKALVAETGANRIIIATNGSGAGNFVVGQTISIGTSGTGNFAVARARKVTSIEDYSSGGVTGKAINFDGDPVNIAVNNVVWSSGQLAGGCDTLGMKSGCLANDNKHAIIYRGIENIFGNVFQWVDGINIKDYQAYVCYDPAEYVSDKFTSPYQKLGYIDGDTEGYIKTLGYDGEHPLISLPTEAGGTGAGSNAYVTDYYYKNTGNRVACVGGTMYSGTNDGLWYWTLNNDSGNTYWSRGARLLRYQ